MTLFMTSVRAMKLPWPPAEQPKARGLLVHFRPTCSIRDLAVELMV